MFVEDATDLPSKQPWKKKGNEPLDIKETSVFLKSNGPSSFFVKCKGQKKKKKKRKKEKEKKNKKEKKKQNKEANKETNMQKEKEIRN